MASKVGSVFSNGKAGGSGLGVVSTLMPRSSSSSCVAGTSCWNEGELFSWFVMCHFPNLN